MSDPFLIEPRRSIPSVDRLLREVGPTSLPRPLLVLIIRDQIERCRNDRQRLDELLPAIHHAVAVRQLSRIQPIINATGIIIHTNFGRSPLADVAVDALVMAARNCTNLEFDLTTGKRGNRGSFVEQGLATLCRAPSATVVNNCAAALVLTLHHFTSASPRKEVIISRGELVQIGGGFRIPDILVSAGAILREVGTTNRTDIDDYARAIGPHTAMILKVHHSNFTMAGFVQSTPLEQLARLAKSAEIPLVDDLGSGSMNQNAAAGEPTPMDSLAAGADLVLFSGDKLFGGPQAGIIAGQSMMIEAIKRDPMYRAFRCDKLILAALQATVEIHLEGQSEQLPIMQMIREPIGQLQSRAATISAAVHERGITANMTESVARIGGGAAPEATIPSVALRLNCDSPDAHIARLRQASPPVIGYIESGAVQLDLRTVFAQQDRLLIDAITFAGST